MELLRKITNTLVGTVGVQAEIWICTTRTRNRSVNQKARKLTPQNVTFSRTASHHVTFSFFVTILSTVNHFFRKYMKLSIFSKKKIWRAQTSFPYTVIIQVLKCSPHLTLMLLPNRYYLILYDITFGTGKSLCIPFNRTWSAVLKNPATRVITYTTLKFSRIQFYCDMNCTKLWLKKPNVQLQLQRKHKLWLRWYEILA
jgi:hypothetical protein